MLMNSRVGKVSVRRMLWLLAALPLLVCCCDGVVKSGAWPPVGKSSVCGKYESSSGGIVHLKDGGVAAVFNVIFEDFMGEGDREVSGLGDWRFERGILGPAEVALGVDRFAFSLSVERGWLGGIHLWRFIDDPDTGERENFIRIADCVS